MLLAEAGTGTGKTLAYLVPAVLSGRRVVISTATKNLQEQIFFKDIPLLARPRWGCRSRRRTSRGAPTTSASTASRRSTRAPLFDRPRGRRATGRRCATGRCAPQTGDRAELDLPDDLRRLARSCPPPRRPASASRSARSTSRASSPGRAGDARRQADVLVVNHHLFFADLAIRARRGGAAEGVLPRYDAVVFDEAHALEDVATELLRRPGLQLPARGAGRRRAARRWAQRTRAAGMLSALALRLRGDAEALFRGGAARAGAAPARGPSGSSRERAAAARPKVGRRCWRRCARCGLPPRADDEPELVGAVPAQRGDRRGAGLHLPRRRRRTTSTGARRAGRGVFLRAAPIDVGEELRQRLYATRRHRGLHLRHARPPRAASTTSPRRVGLWRTKGPAWSRCRQVAGGLAVRLPDARPRSTLPAHLPEPDAPRLRRGGRRRDRRAARADRRARLRALHLAAQHGGGLPRWRGTGCPCRCSCRASGRRPRCSRRSAPSPRCSSPRTASGRAWTCRARRSRWWSSTSCRSPRPATRWWRRGSSSCASAARSRSPGTRCRRRRSRCARGSAG